MIHLLYIHKNLQNGRTLPLLSFDIEKSSNFGVIWDEVIIFKISSIIVISIQENMSHYLWYGFRPHGSILMFSMK